MVSSTTFAAFAKASFVAAASPTATSKARLPGRSGQTCGAPFFSAVDGAGDMRQRLPVDRRSPRRHLSRRQACRRRRRRRNPRHSARLRARGSDAVGILISTSGSTPGVGKGPRWPMSAAGQHQADARHRPHAAEIADPETGMGMRRAHHDRMQAGCRRDIGDVAPCAAQERVVFLARERLAESELHGHLRPSAFVGRLEGSCCPRRADKCTAIQRVTT